MHLRTVFHGQHGVIKIEQGKSYEEIIKELSPKDEPSSDKANSNKKSTGRVRGKARSSTKVSSTTISRVKNCYVNPDGGYRTALERLKEASGENNEQKQ